MADSTDILTLARTHVQAFLLEHLPPGYLYHNFSHAEEVAEVCESLATKAGLPADQQEVLILAAWFHDCGYAKSPEEVGAGSETVAQAFLQKQNYPEQKTREVLELIRKLHARESPKSPSEKILFDANRSYLGRKRFSRRSKLLRLEKQHVQDKKISLDEWNQHVLQELSQHKFHTLWAQERFADRLNRNIVDQRKMAQDALKISTRKKTGKDFGRGVDTLYRITLRNHINLSRIADGKANMIISINTLVLSILITAGTAGISFGSEGLLANIKYTLPVFILMLSSLTTIVFAVLSATPKLLIAKINKEDIKQHKVSLLFFGNFLQLDKHEFVEHLRELKTDQELLYDDLSKDLYNLGAVLKRKYRLLSIAYRVFLGGLVLSFLVFLSLYFL
jgi:HD superfamily phosphodiesterase